MIADSILHRGAPLAVDADMFGIAKGEAERIEEANGAKAEKKARGGPKEVQAESSESLHCLGAPTDTSLPCPRPRPRARP